MGLRILAFPCNQFLSQVSFFYLKAKHVNNIIIPYFILKEYTSNEDIQKFLRKHSITFDVFNRLDVNGKKAAPLFKYLKAKIGGEIQWNFTKFLIDRDGKPIGRYSSNIEPANLENEILFYLSR